MDRFITVHKDFWQFLCKIYFTSIVPKKSLEMNVSKVGYRPG